MNNLILEVYILINNKINLRSDTVTIPTKEMRKAMFDAVVGDDVYGEDETINELEKIASDMFGKESALFVPSGTMSNQLALFVHSNRGDEVILPDRCHIVQHEVGAASIIAGVQLRCIQTINGGEMPLDILENTIRKDFDDIHQPKTALITYENADSDGKVRSIEYMKNIKDIAKSYNLPVHIDGARIFNATCNLDIDVKEISPYFDSISVCLSKGLCAPVGSLLIGDKDFINKARKKRKMLGGGMRQAGILGAAGIVALKEMTKRLKYDNENAIYLAQKLSEIKGIEVFKDNIDINMVFFKLNNYNLCSDALVKYLYDNDVLINGEDNGLMRFVTHNYVSKDEIDRVIELMKLAE